MKKKEELVLKDEEIAKLKEQMKKLEENPELIKDMDKLKKELQEEKSYQTTPQNNLSSLYISPKAQNRNMRYNFNTMKKIPVH